MSLILTSTAAVGLSRGKVGPFLSGSVPTEKCMGNCRRAIRVPCTSSGFRQLPRNRRENTLGLHTIPLLRPAGSAPSRCQSHGSRVYSYMYSMLARRWLFPIPRPMVVSFGLGKPVGATRCLGLYGGRCVRCDGAGGRGGLRLRRAGRGQLGGDWDVERVRKSPEDAADRPALTYTSCSVWLGGGRRPSGCQPPFLGRDSPLFHIPIAVLGISSGFRRSSPARAAGRVAVDCLG
jgi:hypothetical protein